MGYSIQNWITVTVTCFALGGFGLLYAYLMKKHDNKKK